MDVCCEGNIKSSIPNNNEQASKQASKQVSKG